MKIKSPHFDIVKIAGRLLAAASSTWARCLVALCACALMTLLTLIADRMPHSFGNDELTMKELRLADILTGKSQKSVPANILPINIGYDRQLTEVADEFGIPCGVTDVTDRHKLALFLSKIRNAGYAAIGLDVFFDETLPADGDSALFACINSMPRLVVPIHSDGKINPAISKEKYANGDYVVNIVSNNFTKYRFGGSGGIPSMASRLYLLADRDSSYFNPTLADATIILPLPIDMEGPYTEDGDKVWYNLGTDLLDIYSDAELANLVKGKTLVIGDYCQNDIHDSYTGTISGPNIVINALDALRRGKMRINPLSAILTVIVYLLLAGALIFNVTLWQLINRHPKPLLNFALSFVGYGTLLWLLQSLQFFLFSEFHDTLLVTLFLSFYSLFCQKLNDKYPSKILFFKKL